MSGGFAYVYDDQGDFSTRRCNKASVDLEPLDGCRDIETCAICSSAIATSPAALAPPGSSSTGPMRSPDSSRSSPTNTNAFWASPAHRNLRFSVDLAPIGGAAAEVQHG